MFRYIDGYTVLASTTTNDALQSGTFSDTLFKAASMDAITGTSTIQTIDNYSFTSGYIHADNGTDSTYFVVSADSTLLYGYLQPHSVSLSQYAGQRVYLAFVHDSDDDFYLELDDILVSRTSTVATSTLDPNDFQFMTYPNPVVNKLNVLYRLPQAAPVSIRIADMSGRTVQEAFVQKEQAAGAYNTALNVNNLPAGTYSLTLEVGGQALTRVFVK